MSYLAMSKKVENSEKIETAVAESNGFMDLMSYVPLWVLIPLLFIIIIILNPGVLKKLLRVIKILFAKLSETKKLVLKAEEIYSRLDNVLNSHKKMKSEVARLISENQETINNQIKSLKLTNESLAKNLQNFQNNYYKKNDDYYSKIDKSLDTISDTKVALSNIRDFLDSFTQKNKRLEEGYDFKITKRFLNQLIEFYFSIEKQLSKTTDEDAQKRLTYVKEDLVDLLEQNNVLLYQAQEGESIVGNEFYFDSSSEKTKTSDKSLDGKIAASIKEGFHYKISEDKVKVLALNHVSLYKFIDPNLKEEEVKEEVKEEA